MKKNEKYVMMDGKLIAANSGRPQVNLEESQDDTGVWHLTGKASWLPLEVETEADLAGCEKISLAFGFGDAVELFHLQGCRTEKLADSLWRVDYENVCYENVHI